MTSRMHLNNVLLCIMVLLSYLLIGILFYKSKETPTFQQPTKTVIVHPQQPQVKKYEGPPEFRNITISTKHQELAKIYHDYINKVQVKCETVVRMGVSGDGGWDVCMDPPYVLKKPCLVYSFGINNEWSFDDAISKNIGCIVHSFDPSMGRSDFLRPPTIHFHNVGLDGMDRKKEQWNMSTLKTIRAKLLHTNSTIDVLKVDIEESEWPSFPEMVRTGSLSKVKQFCFEIHFLMSIDPDPWRYHNGLLLFKDLYNLGYRIFKSHGNPYCHFKSKFGPSRYLCHEVYMINVNS